MTTIGPRTAMELEEAEKGAPQESEDDRQRAVEERADKITRIALGLKEGDELLPAQMDLKRQYEKVVRGDSMSPKTALQRGAFSIDPTGRVPDPPKR